MKTLTVVLSVLLAVRVGAQVPAWQREAMPLSFAQPSEDLRAKFAADWKRLAPIGKEWKYCITAWRADETKDGDTVFVALDATLQETKATSTSTSTGEHPECEDGQKHRLPTAHSHLNGDCTASRGDRTEAVRRTPKFDLVICGPGITSSYVWTTFRIIQ